MNGLCEKILNIWSDYCIGSWMYDGDKVVLETLEDTFTYDDILSAANDCIDAIEQWIS